MKHIVVDLEMNTVKNNSEIRKICRMETIEIGAVMLDENMQEISSFRTYVKPEFSETIAHKIRRLTGITDEMVANAPKFREGFGMFAAWCAGTGDDFKIYSWSDSDYMQICKEMEAKQYELSEIESRVVSEPWIDFQKEFDVHLGFEKQVSLKIALDMAGIDFEGRQHDALDDARNTAELFQIFRDEELFEKTLKKIEEVMKPSNISSTLGELFDFAAMGIG